MRSIGGDLDGSLAGCSAVITDVGGKVKLAIAYAYQRAELCLENYYDLAIADYDQRSGSSRIFALAYNGQGLAYARTGDRKRAIFDLDHAIRLQPDLAAAYYNRGTVTMKRSWRRAITDFDHAVSSNLLRPRYMQIMRRNACRIKGDYDRAPSPTSTRAVARTYLCCRAASRRRARRDAYSEIVVPQNSALKVVLGQRRLHRHLPLRFCWGLAHPCRPRQRDPASGATEPEGRSRVDLLRCQ